MVNVVEMIADESAFDQPCKFGHRVESHAVYCHNETWEESPRKCRRTWYSGGQVKDEDCPGFEKNQTFSGVFNPSPIPQPFCTQCQGTRITPTDGGKCETCERCCGEGTEPTAIPLSQYEQDTLEIGLGGRLKRGEREVRIVENEEEADSLSKLNELNLIDIHGMSYAKGIGVYLFTLTGKGDAVMRMNWKANKH